MARIEIYFMFMKRNKKKKTFEKKYDKVIKNN